MTKKAEKLIKEHLTKYPKAKPRDVYKLLFQGVYGVGHLFSEKAWDYLVEEASRVPLEGYPEVPLTESVDPDGTIIRVNLRPFLKKKMSLEGLFRVMKSSIDLVGKDEMFLDFWNVFADMVESGVIQMGLEEVKKIQRIIDEMGIKVMHHTEGYREAYYPAYRVVKREAFISEFGEPEDV